MCGRHIDSGSTTATSTSTAISLESGHDSRYSHDSHDSHDSHESDDKALAIIAPPFLSSASMWPAIRGQTTARPFEFLNFGQFAYVGDSKAVVQLQLGNSSLGKYAGDAAYILWKSVYLVKQVSSRTRMLILFDYMKVQIFGRDVSNL